MYLRWQIYQKNHQGLCNPLHCLQLKLTQLHNLQLFLLEIKESNLSSTMLEIM
jgi:hypothetical protein